jgi:hypothetical protein
MISSPRPALRQGFRVVALVGLATASLALAAGLTTGSATPAAAMPSTANDEVPLRLIAAETARATANFRPGSGALSDVVLVHVEVESHRYEAVAARREPFLYIGTTELRPLHVERHRDNLHLTVTFLSDLDAELLEEGAAMVLTSEYGAPQREPERYAQRSDLPRFSRAAFRPTR